MTQFKRNNKLDMEEILVAKPQAFSKNTPVLGASNMNLVDGQFGVASADFYGTVTANTFLAGGETASNVRAIRVIQGTPASSNLALADAWQVSDPAYVASDDIHKDNVRSLTLTKPRTAVYSATAVVDFPAPLDNSDYGIIVEMDSNQIEKTHGFNTKSAISKILSPDFTALGTTSPKDYVLQNLLYKLNLNSFTFAGENGDSKGKDPFVALAINAAGGAGTPIGAIVVGDEIPFMTYKGITSSVTVTPEMVAGLAKLMKLQAEAVAAGDATEAIVAASTIEVIDLTTAGAAAKVDGFIVLGERDSIPLGVNTNPNYTVDVTVNLTDAFRVSEGFSQTKSYSEESKNMNWSLANRRRSQRMNHNLYVETDYPSFNVVEGFNYVGENTPYTSAILDYFDYEETLTREEHNPKQLVMLMPAVMDVTETVTTVLAAYTSDTDNLFSVIAVSADGATSNVPFVTDYNAVFVPWVASTNAVIVGTLS